VRGLLNVNCDSHACQSQFVEYVVSKLLGCRYPMQPSNLGSKIRIRLHKDGEARRGFAGRYESNLTKRQIAMGPGTVKADVEGP